MLGYAYVAVYSVSYTGYEGVNEIGMNSVTDDWTPEIGCSGDCTWVIGSLGTSYSSMVCYSKKAVLGLGTGG
jgi:hypothetical protein